MPKTLIERGLEAHKAIKRFERAMQAEFPVGKTVLFTFPGRPTLSGTVSLTQYLPAEAILGGLIVDVTDDVKAQCPTYAQSPHYDHVTVGWVSIFTTKQTTDNGQLTKDN